ncbi:MAG: CotH kinase family protein [Kofleriaceae bacterium]|nr:CotH kinase family protein [Kofleriaceae bacterium]
MLGGACRSVPTLDKQASDTTPLLEFELSATARKSLRRKPKGWVFGSLWYRGKHLPNVALRLKGQRSLRSLSDKPSLKLRVDKAEQHHKRRFLGRGRWTLENMVEDPSMVRAYLAQQLATKVGLAVPTSRYVRVKIDGQSQGLYLLAEATDTEFLAQHFGTGTGPLYEGEYGCDLHLYETNCFDLESGKDPERVHLHKLAKRAADPDARLWGGSAAPFELDHIATVLAFGTYIGDFDGYHHAHNYRLYFSPADRKWRLLPSGMDRVFSKVLAPFSGEGVLAKRCFSDSQCRDSYRKAWRRIAKSASELDPEGIIDRLSQTMSDSQRKVLKAQGESLRTFLDGQLSVVQEDGE